LHLYVFDQPKRNNFFKKLVEQVWQSSTPQLLAMYEFFMFFVVKFFQNKSFRKERITMKKNIFWSAAACCVLLLIVSSAQGDMIDLPRDGNKVVEKSKNMIDAGQKLKDAKNPDRAWLTEQGQLISKSGRDAMDSSSMMRTIEGKKNMRGLGQKLLQAGNLLFNMGKLKGEVTQEEKAKIAKQAEVLLSFGAMMLKKGQVMGGQ
jgi:hypothetical protein